MNDLIMFILVILGLNGGPLIALILLLIEKLMSKHLETLKEQIRKGEK